MGKDLYAVIAQIGRVSGSFPRPGAHPILESGMTLSGRHEVRTDYLPGQIAGTTRDPRDFYPREMSSRIPGLPGLSCWLKSAFCGCQSDSRRIGSPGKRDRDF